MTPPLVAIITPTWQRPELLFQRCIPSVAAQTYPNIEHIIVHDGPCSDEFRARFIASHQPGFRRLLCLPEHAPNPHWGGYARQAAIESIESMESLGAEYIGYVDDDDVLMPEHTQLLMEALLADPELGFAYSQMVSHQPSGDVVYGTTVPPVYGQIGTPMIMHRRSVLDIATWGEPDAAEDWKLIEAWLAKPVKYIQVPVTTIEVFPSTYASLA